MKEDNLVLTKDIGIRQKRDIEQENKIEWGCRRGEEDTTEMGDRYTVQYSGDLEPKKKTEGRRRQNGDIEQDKNIEQGN